MDKRRISLSLCKKSDLDVVRKRKLIYELKLDGVRAVSIEGRLYNRKSGTNRLNRDISRQFPEINIPKNCVLDGEIVSEGGLGDVTGRSLLQDDFKVMLRSEENPLKFIVFDILYLNGRDLRGSPLLKRKEILSRQDLGGNVEVIPYYNSVNSLWKKVVKRNLEGVIAKDPQSPYDGVRSNSWLKVKNWKESTFEVKDYERTRNGGFVVYVKLRNGQTQRIAVNGRREQETITHSSNSRVEVQYLEVTKKGRLRKPTVKRVLH